jgi:diguanylate cyclase (GGDEF)-like protein/PAS domain S-box-containing protein
MSTRTLLTRFTAWMLFLAVAVYLFPSQHAFIWTAIGLSSVAAIIIGTRRNSPRRRAPWLLLAAAVCCLVAGDLSADLLVRVFHQADPFPSVADVLYLSMYVLIALGMFGLYRLGVVRHDIAGLLDALMLTTGVALLSWVYLIGPYVDNPHLTLLQKTISISYPLGDIMILAVGASLVASVRATPSVWLLALGGLGLLASDIAYGLIQLHGTWRVGTPADLGWIVFYIGWGAAALHPSMRKITEPTIVRRHEEQLGRLVLLGLVSLIAPTMLFIEFTVGEVNDGAMIAVVSAALSILVLVRLGLALRVHRQAVIRERALRTAGAALLVATDVPTVSTVVAEAVGHLLPPGRAHRVHVTDNDARASGAPAMVMVYTRTLDPPLAAALGEFEVTLRCPVAVDGRGALGFLYISADEITLVGLQEAAQVLATQAALALERIRLSAEIDRRNSEAYFRTLVVNTADVILILDDDDRIRYASPSAATLSLAAEPSGRALPDLVDPVSAAEARRRLDRVRAGQPDHAGQDWCIRRADDTDPALVEVSCRDLRADATVAGLVVTLRDVTESRRMQEELYRQATLDALTGLPNREVFVNAAQSAIGRATRRGRLAGVIVTELDDFKRVNNTMGHGAGDELLMIVGRRLRDAVGRACGEDRSSGGDPHEIVGWGVARLGGDEFAAFVDATDDAEVDQVVAAIMGCFAEPFTLGRTAISVTGSIGVATTIEAADAQELLRQADLAVYVAKDAGKGRSMRYESSLHTTIVDRLRLRADLERAVTTGDFVLDYQPIVALDTGRTAGFEALVRWRHPVRGLIPPGLFIDLAEESGLIVPLGAWVLRHAVEAAASWARLGPEPHPYVSVNVSARQFRAPRFVEQVRQELRRSGLPPSSLVLEITESLLVRDGGVGETLNTLRGDGVRIAIDDFGTGFSSLSYLRRLPVDVLKLDKSFVDAVTSSREQHAIITAINQLAEALHLDVVAEGIENRAELDVVSTVGCGFGQGYLLSRPLSYRGAVRWLREQVPALAAPGRDSPS